MMRETIRLAKAFVRARPAASKGFSPPPARATKTPRAGAGGCDPRGAGKRPGGRTGVATLLRYLEENGHRQVGEILAGAEEGGLWKDTPFESANTFAAFVGSSGNRASADATTEVLHLAARIVEARGGNPSVAASEVMGVANGLSRYFLVAGLKRQMDLADRN